jgi:hypothetical protein
MRNHHLLHFPEQRTPMTDNNVVDILEKQDIERSRKIISAAGKIDEWVSSIFESLRDATEVLTEAISPNMLRKYRQRDIQLEGEVEFRVNLLRMVLDEMAETIEEMDREKHSEGPQKGRRFLSNAPSDPAVLLDLQEKEGLNRPGTVTQEGNRNIFQPL